MNYVPPEIARIKAERKARREAAREVKRVQARERTAAAWREALDRTVLRSDAPFVREVDR